MLWFQQKFCQKFWWKISFQLPSTSWQALRELCGFKGGCVPLTYGDVYLVWKVIWSYAHGHQLRIWSLLTRGLILCRWGQWKFCLQHQVSGLEGKILHWDLDWVKNEVGPHTFNTMADFGQRDMKINGMCFIDYNCPNAWLLEQNNNS